MDDTNRERLKATVATRLKKLREKLGFSTAAEFADHVGVRPHALWRYEHGRVLPDPETLVRIAKKCGVTVDSLLAVDTTKEPGPKSA